MPFKILVADDNINDKFDEISRLPEMLKAAGYEVVTTADGVGVYDLVLESRPDLVVLDIEFKRQPVNGFEICQAIRSNDPDIPIILITVPRTDREYVLRGFNAGANDYVRRPQADNCEIIARIRANLPPGALVVDDYLYVDLEGSQVCIKQGENWQKVDLQSLLFELLKVLIMNAGLVVLTTRLKDILWGDKPVSDAALAVCIHRLREKIEPDPVHPKYIENVKGLGYRFNGKPVHTSRRPCED
jgi:DNA-binding response OmpR family regulator